MKTWFAECFGTFCLVFAGTGAIIVDQITAGSISHVGVALTFGLVVLVMIETVGEVSGAHLNPAVTLGFWLAGRFPAARVLPYVLSQGAGAVMASVMLKFLFPQHGLLGVTVPAGSATQSFIMEFLLTLILMTVILSVSQGAREKGLAAALSIGGTVGLGALFAGPISGASMNPARSLGPALISGHLQHLWIYLTATTLGALTAVPLCCAILDKPCCRPSAKEG